MKTLLDHVKNLSRYTEDSEDTILKSILYNEFIIDEDSLFAYFIDRLPWGTSLTITWIDGDSKKIKGWIQKIMEENGCTKMYGITKRWKAFQRKYGGKPIGILMEREAF